jgi:hypothetical protein
MSKRRNLAALESEIVRSRSELTESWAAFRARVPSRHSRGRRLPAAAPQAANKPPSLPLGARVAAMIGIGVVLVRVLKRRPPLDAAQ